METEDEKGARERREHLERVMTLGRRRAVPVMVEALRDEDRAVVFTAAAYLGQIQGEWIALACRRLVAARTGSALTREGAAYILSWVALGIPRSRLWTRRVREALLRAALDPDDHPLVRGQAIEGLANYYDKNHRSERRRIGWQLLPLLEDPAPEVRFWTAFALGTLLYRKAEARLKRMADEDTGFCEGWWAVSDEAADAVIVMNGGEAPERVPVSSLSVRSERTPTSDGRGGE